MEIVGLFISPEHNYFGHFGKPPGEAPTVAVDEVRCVAGKGIEGDRFYHFKPERFPDGYDGQVTFFAEETWWDVAGTLKVEGKGPEVFRRNVVTRGVELNELKGVEFSVQGVKFLGVKEASPCQWMNEAFAPGALSAMKGRGGLRARVLTDGVLRVGVGD